MKLVDPVEYGRTRNFLSGAVTRLSPYISRGVISTRQVFEVVIAKGYALPQIEKFIQELCWRDYWQQVWMARKNSIDDDLKKKQPLALRQGMPSAITQHQTGIDAIDNGVKALYATGYMHNHLRMYVASLACNVARCHWRHPARWMYYHLLDGDWASNALSWQWVCGANSNKLYYANQENINKYCNTNQSNTFLDIGYEDFHHLHIPALLQESTQPLLRTTLPMAVTAEINPALPTLVYNYYNIDPNWRNNVEANRVLLLEPTIFDKYPVAQKNIEFAVALAQTNIPGIQVFVGEFAELQVTSQQQIYFKEHPLNNYVGVEDPRDWMSKVTGDFPSFFSFWKKCRKELLGGIKA